MSFLPMNKKDMLDRGWNEVDFCIVTGDAYVDHPTFGTAIISRVLEAEGFKVGIIAQPNVKNTEDMNRFGKPKLGYMINAGNIDSMVAHYTAAKKKRTDDAYSPGNKAGKRPDRAVTVYSQLVKSLYPDIPVIIGGLEASLRRFAHYDYWSDKVMPSVLIDSGADLLSFGMGEKQTVQIANRLKDGQPIETLTDIKGTCYVTKDVGELKGVMLASYNQVKTSKTDYTVACRTEYDEQDAVRGKRLIQPHDSGKFVVQNPPMEPLTTEELDKVYALPYERYYHPIYESMGGVPAITEVEFSLTHNRGCFGACNFCSIAFHQGRQIAVRSKQSVLDEAVKLTESPHFKGYIHDVGGPTANFRSPSCKRQLKYGLCKGKKCLAPTACDKLEVSHEEYLDLLHALRELKRVKRVFIRSGIRYDYLMKDKNDAFIKELIKNHVSGQLKVAPEHCSAAVLDKMGKPHIEAYKAFSKRFYDITKGIGKEQYLVPYLMSSHPGSTLRNAVELAVFLKKEHIRPEQVQDFYPTPGTLSTCMFYTELDPYTLEPVFVPKTYEEKQMQRALLQYFKPQNKETIVKALKLAGRTDLIGHGKDCLILPPAGYIVNKPKQSKAKGSSNRWEPKPKKRR